jgi:hypothetical protein
VEVNWRYFAGAGILAGYILIANGAPAGAVFAGIGLAAGVTLFNRRRAR